MFIVSCVVQGDIIYYYLFLIILKIAFCSYINNYQCQHVKAQNVLQQTMHQEESTILQEIMQGTWCAKILEQLRKV